MSDAAFLRAILDHPEDDGPRLVYADWLDEQGDPRGEFIRVQCRIAELVGLGCHEGRSCNVTGHCDECHREGEVSRLRQCERALWIAHCVEWTKGKPYCSALTEGEFCIKSIHGIPRRGFVEEITCTAADWLGGLCTGCSNGVGWGYQEHPNDCPACHGIDHLPSYAAAILAAAPVGTVRLTTFPDIEYLPGVGVGGSYRLRGHRRLTQPDVNDRTPWENLAALEWPGIRFQLPEADLSYNNINVGRITQIVHRRDGTTPMTTITLAVDPGPMTRPTRDHR